MNINTLLNHFLVKRVFFIGSILKNNQTAVVVLVQFKLEDICKKQYYCTLYNDNVLSKHEFSHIIKAKEEK